MVALGYVLSAAYGVLLLDRSFSPIELTTQNGVDRSGPYLISRTTTQMIIWDPRQFNILSIPENTVVEAKIGKPSSLTVRESRR